MTILGIFYIVCGDDSTIIMNTKDILKQIGLSENESKVYLALLNFKKATVSKIAVEAHINRTTAYDILNYLNQKGLILKYIENKKTGFSIDSPKRLKQWLKDERRKIDVRESLLEEKFDEIQYLFKSTGEAPRVRYFEGNKQIGDFISDSLLSNPEETIGYGATRLITEKLKQHEIDDSFIQWYAKERSIRNIYGRFIVQEADRENLRTYLKKFYSKYLTKEPNIIRVKILPTKNTKYFLNETTIYGNKLAISHFSNDFYGVIIESEDAANTQRIVFESLWKMLKEEIKV